MYNDDKTCFFEHAGSFDPRRFRSRPTVTLIDHFLNLLRDIRVSPG